MKDCFYKQMVQLTLIRKFRFSGRLAICRCSRGHCLFVLVILHARKSLSSVEFKRTAKIKRTHQFTVRMFRFKGKQILLSLWLFSSFLCTVALPLFFLPYIVIQIEIYSCKCQYAGKKTLNLRKAGAFYTNVSLLLAIKTLVAIASTISYDLTNTNSEKLN